MWTYKDCVRRFHAGRRLRSWIVLGAVAASIGCSNPQPTSKLSPASGTLLRGAGATFPLLLYKEWFATYQRTHPDVAISYEAVGSGEGVRRFIGKDVDEEGRIDFGASDAAMTDDQIAAVSHGVLMVPVTAGSLVLAYNLPDYSGELRLSRVAYEGIFLGEITTWDDELIAKANPGKKLPKLPISLVVRQDRSGTTYAFSNHLDAISQKWHARYGANTLVAWPGNPMRANGNEGVGGRIKQSIGSLGYLNFGSAQQAGLPMALLENRSGNFVQASPEAGAAALASVDLPENLRAFIPDPPGATSYPIVTFSWILLPKKYDDSKKAAAARDLFNWCLSVGQASAPALGYLALPSSVTDRAAAALDSIGSGS